MPEKSSIARVWLFVIGARNLKNAPFYSISSKRENKNWTEAGGTHKPFSFFCKDSGGKPPNNIDRHEVNITIVEKKEKGGDMDVGY